MDIVRGFIRKARTVYVPIISILTLCSLALLVSLARGDNAGSVGTATDSLPKPSTVASDSLPPSPAPEIEPPAVQSAVGEYAIRTPVLMYHYVRDVDKARDQLGYALSVSAAELENQLKLFTTWGYVPTTMQAVAEGRAPKNGMVLTFDDGYADFYTTAFPLLKQYGWTATAYIITGKVGGQYMTWDQIREISTAGFEIGGHTVTHPDLSRLPEVRQREEIVSSKTTLEKVIGKPVQTFAYPAGRYSQTTVHQVFAGGYTNAVTTKTGFSVPAEQGLFELHRLRVRPNMAEEDFAELLGR